MTGSPGLTRQKPAFFDLFRAAAANGAEIARLLVALLEMWPDSRELLRAIRDAEHEGDRLTYEVVTLLNTSVETPFDRDDMYRLATVLDDICDHVEEAADDIDAYEVRDVPVLAVEQARVVERAAVHLREAMMMLEGPGDPRDQLVAVRELEDEGDRLSREAVAGVCRSHRDALTIIRWKDIHEQIEEAVDACENVADVLEAILVKNL
jgi:uncharacterized protein Yka (UPF0111/DUF47 family)